MTEKLEIVEASLADLDEQLAVVVRDSNLRLDIENLRGMNWVGQDIIFHVAPLEPTYSGRGLEALRRKIAPEIEPDDTEKSARHFPRSITPFWLGANIYRENIGTISVYGDGEFVSGTSSLVSEQSTRFSFDISLTRSIFVKLFPDVRLAANAEPEASTFNVLTPPELFKAKRDYRRYGALAVYPL